MATTTREMPVSLEQVWAALADPFRYAKWVVGAKRVRDVEGTWPEEQSSFHHTIGVWPVRLRDKTSVLECDAPRRLVLEARGRPFGQARVELDLRSRGEGTVVSMTEVPTTPALARWARPLIDPITHMRNVEALRRLAGLFDEPDR